jgi:hypothetical protein
LSGKLNGPPALVERYKIYPTAPLTGDQLIVGDWFVLVILLLMLTLPGAVAGGGGRGFAVTADEAALVPPAPVAVTT